MERHFLAASLPEFEQQQVLTCVVILHQLHQYQLMVRTHPGLPRCYHIVNCLDNKQTVCAAFLDLRKAFDSLDHCLLLHRLQDLGVGTVVLQWFQNYLSNRRHRVKRSNIFSDWVEMQGGIPQGSALGPLLFLVYMNSLPSQVTEGLLLQYADDTTLICSGSTPDIVATTVSIQLSHIQSWIDRSRMKLNFTKSCVMWFSVNASRLPTYPPITVDNSVLRVVTEQKYLGLVFDSQLSWSSHVSGVCKKMSYYLHLLNSHRYVLNNSITKLLLDSLVLSHIYYALPVWGPSLNVQLLSRLKRMQNRAVRLAFSLNMIMFLIIISDYIGFPWINLLNFVLCVQCTNSFIKDVASLLSHQFNVYVVLYYFVYVALYLYCVYCVYLYIVHVVLYLLYTLYCTYSYMCICIVLLWQGRTAPADCPESKL